MSIKFEDLHDDYARLWTTMSLRPGWAGKAEGAAKGIFTNKDSYRAVESLTGVPWFVVGLIHQMECDLDFHEHLHNGGCSIVLGACLLNFGRRSSQIFIDSSHYVIDCFIDMFRGEHFSLKARSFYRFIDDFHDFPL